MKPDSPSRCVKMVKVKIEINEVPDNEALSVKSSKIAISILVTVVRVEIVTNWNNIPVTSKMVFLTNILGTVPNKNKPRISSTKITFGRLFLLT